MQRDAWGCREKWCIVHAGAHIAAVQRDVKVKGRRVDQLHYITSYSLAITLDVVLDTGGVTLRVQSSVVYGLSQPSVDVTRRGRVTLF